MKITDNPSLISIKVTSIYDGMNNEELGMLKNS